MAGSGGAYRSKSRPVLRTARGRIKRRLNYRNLAKKHTKRSGNDGTRASWKKAAAELGTGRTNGGHPEIPPEPHLDYAQKRLREEERGKKKDDPDYDLAKGQAPKPDAYPVPIQVGWGARLIQMQLG